MVIPTNLIILLILIVGGIFLQIFLSKKKNKWYGLILPFICFIFSLVAVLGNTAFFVTGEVGMQQFAPDGTLIAETVETQNIVGSKDIVSTIVQMLITFLLYNIPTAILLLIYFDCREKIKKRSALEKMNIQDLE